MSLLRRESTLWTLPISHHAPTLWRSALARQLAAFACQRSAPARQLSAFACQRSAPARQRWFLLASALPSSPALCFCSPVSCVLLLHFFRCAKADAGGFYNTRCGVNGLFSSATQQLQLHALSMQ
jgi:hypothetical protein